MIAILREDAAPYLRGWRRTSRKPAWMLWMRLMLLTPGFQFVFWIRFQRTAKRWPVVGGALSRLAWYYSSRAFASDVDPTAQIGPGLHVPHPSGIVIGGGCRVGANVAILQHVTLGQAHRGSKASPVIEDGAEIGVGACVLGAIRVGRGAVIGANSVVLKDVPAGSIAVGSPARILERRAQPALADEA